jgi:hypothetical protein
MTEICKYLRPFSETAPKGLLNPDDILKLIVVIIIKQIMSKQIKL